jgi:hypothetical protein
MFSFRRRQSPIPEHGYAEGVQRPQRPDDNRPVTLGPVALEFWRKQQAFADAERSVLASRRIIPKMVGGDLWGDGQ